MTSPARTADGFPVITLQQAERDAAQVREQVITTINSAQVRLNHGEVEAAAEHVESARAALDWLADRLAIAEGGSLGRVPSTGDDTPAE